MFALPPVSRALDDAIRHAIDSKTKPLGALGMVETLAAQVARIQGTLTPRLDRCRLTLFAGDHGIAHEGVSAYPQAVTRQMVANFLAGGAAANVFARANGVDLQVVDAGVAGDPMDAPGLVVRRIAGGTRNFAVEPAMTEVQCGAALGAGEEIGAKRRGGRGGVRRDGHRQHVVGHPDRPQAHRRGTLDALIGRGTGLDDEGLARKSAVLGRAAARTAESARRPRGAARVRRLRDRDDGRRDDRGGAKPGRWCSWTDSSRARRRSRRSGSRRRCGTTWSSRTGPPSRATERFWRALDARPLLDFDMRLGEGTGALIAWPVLKCAAAMMSEMASFESAGVSGPSA